MAYTLVGGRLPFHAEDPGALQHQIKFCEQSYTDEVGEGPSESSRDALQLGFMNCWCLSWFDLRPSDKCLRTCGGSDVGAVPSQVLVRPVGSAFPTTFECSFWRNELQCSL